MRCSGDSIFHNWKYFNFNGKTAWREETGKSDGSTERRKYMLNAYRVLLTRARMGMVICVPTGNPNLTIGSFLEDALIREIREELATEISVVAMWPLSSGITLPFTNQAAQMLQLVAQGKLFECQ